ncbi:hypothetical protein BH20VER3_BH20VER3_00500 [soil metagenome]
MKFPRLSTALALLLALFVAFHISAFAGVGFALLAFFALLAPVPTYRLGLNTVDAELSLAKLLDIVLEGFVQTLLPLRAFSLGVTGGRTLNALGTKDVLVPYVPFSAEAVKDFNAANGDCYEGGDTQTDKRKVTIDRRKYVSFGFNSEELAVTPILNNIDFARIKGQRLAEVVLTDILSIVTAVNFPNAEVVGAASAFDTDDVFDIRSAMNGLKMPKTGRQLILSDDYDTALLKDNKDTNLYGSTDPRWEARIPRIAGMDEYGTEIMPATGNLVGIANFPSAILVANAPLEPLPQIRQALADFRVITHDETGLSFVYKEIVDPRCDELLKVIECTYGFAKGEEDALLRLTSA